MDGDVKEQANDAPQNTSDNGPTDGYASVGAISILSDRLNKVESILAHLAETPPPMSDAEKITQQLTVIRGEIGRLDTHLMTLDGFADVSASLNARMARMEAHGGVAPLPVARDMAHETRTVVREFKCLGCGATSTDTVSSSVVNAQEKPCSVCSNIAVVVATHADADAKAASDYPASQAGIDPTFEKTPLTVM